MVAMSLGGIEYQSKDAAEKSVKAMRRRYLSAFDSTKPYAPVGSSDAAILRDTFRMHQDWTPEWEAEGTEIIVLPHYNPAKDEVCGFGFGRRKPDGTLEQVGYRSCFQSRTPDQIADMILRRAIWRDMKAWLEANKYFAGQWVCAKCDSVTHDATVDHDPCFSLLRTLFVFERGLADDMGKTVSCTGGTGRDFAKTSIASDFAKWHAEGVAAEVIWLRVLCRSCNSSRGTQDFSDCKTPKMVSK
jgi:hypothetical protein